jgi:glucose/arabinose dehydrogenase
VRHLVAGSIVGALLVGGCSGPADPAGTSSPPSSPVSPSGSASAPSPASPERPSVHATIVAELDQPVGMAVRNGDAALYVVSKTGTVLALRNGALDLNPDPVLDLSEEVSAGDEQGLLGMTFSPDGTFAYLNFTDVGGDTNVVEYSWTEDGPALDSRRTVLFVDQPFPNHNGGDLVFGPDGHLYIGLGDGGSDYTRGDSQGDPDRNGQNLEVLLGKMLRIAPRLPDGSLPPNGDGYAVPDDNPFVGVADARPEIWAYGLRNPWRYSFDRETGDLWIGDVGAGAREEIDLQSAGSAGGENYGWNVMEGTVPWRSPPPDAVPPIHEYPHTSRACSVTGGYMYRGSAIQNLAGWYVFGDYCSGAISGLQMTPDGPRVYIISGDHIASLTAFGEDAAGELYAMSLDGGVYRIVP